MSSEENFLIIVKAKELAVHTFKLTSNCNRYPKKYRFSLVGKLQNKALTLYEALDVNQAVEDYDRAGLEHTI